MAAAAKKKKGMSLEEKREAMLDIFHSTKEVFNLKELEKLGAKAGVVRGWGSPGRPFSSR